MPTHSDGQKKDEPTAPVAQSDANAVKKPETDLNECDKPAPGAAGSAAETIKVCSDAIFALMKAALLAMAGAIIILASGTVIWRDLHQRLINVNIEPQAEKLLRDHAIYFDLPSTLVDEVNARIYGVDEIVRSEAFENILPTENSEAVSFKPFGLDISTNDITSLVRNVFRTLPEFVVQIGMMCSPFPCDEARAAGSPTWLAGKLTLLVKLKGPTKNQLRSFPLAAGSRGLRRGLREAMEKTSMVLEQADPLRASVLYLNEPWSMVFDDERIKYWDMVASTTFAPGARVGAGRCLADLVFGDSMVHREDFQSGLDTLRLVSANPDVSAVGKIHAQTDTAGYLALAGECGPPDSRMPSFRAAFAALESLKSIKRQAMSQEEHSRIVEFELTTEIMQAFSKLVDEGSRDLLCGRGGHAADIEPKAKRYASLIPLIDGLPARVPHDRDNNSIHAVVELLSEMQENIATRGDLWSRYEVSRAILKLIGPYLHNDSHPRVLFMAQGQALMDMTLAELDLLSTRHDARLGQSLQSSISSNLRAATVAFENAAATSSISALTEPFSDLEPRVMLGDALYLGGDERRAKAAYAAAAKEFVEEDEPLNNDMVSLAKAAARWATILIEEGACKNKPARDQDWDAVWSPLGATKDKDLCLFTRADPAQAEVDKFGMLRVLYRLISESVRCTCAKPDAVGEICAKPNALRCDVVLRSHEAARVPENARA
jgi:hypothetical protein